MNEPRITPTKLAALCAPGFCPRCYWRLLRLEFKKPFLFPLPAIMQHLDKHQKQGAIVSLRDEGELPKFFGPFASATEVVPVASLSGYHEPTKLKLFGKPDLVLKAEDGTLMVLDNKTADVKAEDHPLSAAYRVQVNFYAYLLTHAEMAQEVSRAGLVYYVFSPVKDDDIPDYFSDYEVLARFEPKAQEVELDPDRIIPPLLKKVRQLLDLTEAPEPKADCPDCELISLFANLLMDDQEKIVPVWLSQREIREYLIRQDFRQLTDAQKQLKSKLPLLSMLADPLGVLRMWDFSAESNAE